jgi:hypothetical protein
MTIKFFHSKTPWIDGVEHGNAADSSKVQWFCGFASGFVGGVPQGGMGAQDPYISVNIFQKKINIELFFYFFYFIYSLLDITT